MESPVAIMPSMVLLPPQEQITSSDIPFYKEMFIYSAQILKLRINRQTGSSESTEFAKSILDCEFIGSYPMTSNMSDSSYPYISIVWIYKIICKKASLTTS